MRAFILALPFCFLTLSCASSIDKRTTLRQMPPALGPVMDLNTLNNPHKNRGY
jgi:hypothetical protein